MAEVTVWCLPIIYQQNINNPHSPRMGAFERGVLERSVGPADTALTSTGFIGLDEDETHFLLLGGDLEQQELVQVITHRAGFASVIRGAEGTVAQAWLAGTRWIKAMAVK